MKILITGSDGFIGSKIKRHLISLGYEVTGISYLRQPEADELRADIRNLDHLNKLSGDWEVIIHCAGIVDQTLSRKLMMQVNAHGTNNMLDFAAASKCRHFIHMSSISVYGYRVMGQNRKEDETPILNIPFVFPYGESKAKAEELVLEGGVPYTILRLPAVIGSQDSYFSKAIMPRLLNQKFSFFGKGDPLVSILYVKNLCTLLEKVITVSALNSAFNCCFEAPRWSEIIWEYCKHLQIGTPSRRRSILAALPRFGDKSYMLMALYSYFGSHFCGDKLQRVLNFVPSFSWKNGVRDACISYLDEVNG